MLLLFVVECVVIFVFVFIVVVSVVIVIFSRLVERCHPNWSNDSYSKIFLRINVGPKKTSFDNRTKKDMQQICRQLLKKL